MMQHIWSLYTMALLIAPMPLLNIQEAGTCNRLALAKDSIVVAESNQRIVINVHAPKANIHLKANKLQPFQKDKKYCLLMVGIKEKQPPEGVYEVYITPSGSTPAKLVPESRYFIDVLNTYNISSEKASHLYLDVTNQLFEQNSSNKHLLDYTVTVAFKGNLKPDKTSATNAGILIIDTIQLLQTDRL